MSEVDLSIIAGRYKPERVIGEGAVGRVLKCYDLKLGNFVAVKVLHANTSGKKVVRLQNEAKAAARLNHPNIIKVLDFGQTEDRRSFLVMELCEGESLAEVIAREGGLCLDESLLVFLQICFGLGYAHKHGVLHRDIKPSNVILTRSSNSQLNVKLCDFGVAKLEDDEQNLTQSGGIVGTPSYISPESATGREADARSDIYSLGCLIFETITGEAPFTGSSNLEIITSRLHMDPPTLEEKTGRVFPPLLEEIARRCLMLEPEKRYQNTEELERALTLAVEQISPPHQDRARVSPVQPDSWQSSGPPDGSFNDPANKVNSAVSGVQKNEPMRMRRMGLYSPTAIAVITILLVGAVGLAVRITSEEVHVDTTLSPEILEFFEVDADKSTVIEKKDGIEWTRRHGLLSDNDIKKFSPDVKYIMMTHDTFLGDGFKALVGRPILGLKLPSDRISDTNMKYIGKLKHLQILDLHESRDYSLSGFKNLEGCQDLRSLSLSETKINEDFIGTIACLRKLTFLNLDGCKEITGENIDRLAVLNELDSLNIGHTGFNHKFLPRLLELRQIRHLDLSGNGITDGDLQQLVEINISELDLADNKITDQGVRFLSRMKHLQKVDLTGNSGITSRALLRLINERPEIQVKS